MPGAVNIEWTQAVQPSHIHLSFSHLLKSGWSGCSWAQGILPSCAALPPDGSSVSPEPFHIDGWIGWYQLCISICPLNAAFLKSATRIGKSPSLAFGWMLTPALCWYLVPRGPLLGWGGIFPVMAVQPWCLAFQLWLLGSWVVGRKLQSGATLWQRGAKQQGDYPGMIRGREGTSGDPAGQRSWHPLPQTDGSWGDLAKVTT